MKSSTIFSLSAVCCLSFSLSAMPTKDELAEMEGLVSELVADDFSAMKEGKKTRSQVAKACLGYVDDAETEAAKLLLIKKAFDQYMSCGEFKNAVDAFASASNSIKDIPDGLLGEWAAPYLPKIGKAGRADGFTELIKHAVSAGDSNSADAIAKQVTPFRKRLSKAKTWPQLQTALNEVIRLKAQRKDLVEIKARLREQPDNAELHEKLAVVLVGLGDWDSALKEFVQAGGKVAEVAAWEGSYPETGLSELTSADVAEFWWGYTSEEKVAETTLQSFRRHAAKWFKVAIDNGSLKGLKRTLAEKRIVGFDNLEEAPAVETAGASASTPAAPEKVPQPISIVLDKNKTAMMFMGCPAGEFDMGAENSKWDGRGDKHRVRISRPFWIAKTPTSWAQACAIEGEDFEKVVKNLSATHPLLKDFLSFCGKEGPTWNFSRSSVEDYCTKLTKRYSAKIPRGYVFRLPTMAEWEYACRANTKDPNDPFATPVWYGRGIGREVAVGPDDIKARATQLGLECVIEEKGGYVLNRKTNVRLDVTKISLAVGTKKPNRWGLYDMIGLCNEMFLDKMPSAQLNQELFYGQKKVKDWGFKDGVVDPLYYTDEQGVVWLYTFCSTPFGGWGGSPVLAVNTETLYRLGCGFRLVIGPDLVKERKARRK